MFFKLDFYTGTHSPPNLEMKLEPPPIEATRFWAGGRGSALQADMLPLSFGFSESWEGRDKFPGDTAGEHRGPHFGNYYSRIKPSTPSPQEIQPQPLE